MGIRTTILSTQFPLRIIGFVVLLGQIQSHSVFGSTPTDTKVSKTAEAELAKLRKKIAIFDTELKNNAEANLQSRLYLKARLDNVLDNGIRLYHANFFDAACSELNLFLYDSQAASLNQIAKAHYYLALSYRKLNNDLWSLDHFSSFLRLKHKQVVSGEVEVAQALRAINELINYQHPLWHTEAEELLQTISNLDLNEAIGDLNFLTSNTFIHHRSQKEASQWLKDKTGSYFGSGGETRLIYLQGLMASFEGDYTRALAKFESLSDRALTDNPELADLVTLAIARTLHLLKKDTASLEYYQRIRQKSTFYESALYEQLIVASEVPDYSLAPNAAENYLALYPHGTHAAEVRSLRPFVHLISGNLSVVKKYINDQMEQLKIYDATISDIGKKNTKSNLKKILSLDGSLIGLPEDLQKAKELLDRNNANKSRIAQIAKRNEQTLKQIALERQSDIFPVYRSLLEQQSLRLANISKFGNDLISTSSAILDKSLTQDTKISLELLQKRINQYIINTNTIDFLFIEQKKNHLALGNLINNLYKLKNLQQKLYAHYSNLSLIAGQDQKVELLMQEYVSLNSEIIREERQITKLAITPQLRNLPMIAYASKNTQIVQTFQNAYHRIVNALGNQQESNDYAQAAQQEKLKSVWEAFFVLFDRNADRTNKIIKDSDDLYATKLKLYEKTIDDIKALTEVSQALDSEIYAKIDQHKDLYLRKIKTKLRKQYSLLMQWQGDFDWIKSDQAKSKELAIKARSAIKELQLQEVDIKNKMGFLAR